MRGQTLGDDASRFDLRRGQCSTQPPPQSPAITKPIAAGVTEDELVARMMREFPHLSVAELSQALLQVGPIDGPAVRQGLLAPVRAAGIGVKACGLGRHDEGEEGEAQMTAKRDRAIDIAREIFRHSDADISPEESLKTIHRKFPGITKVDFERATNVMIAQTEMFAEDMSERVAQLKALLPGALLENLAGKLTGPFHDAFHMAADECEALGEMTADTLFPTKPDKRKS